MVSRYVQGTATPGADVVSRIVDARPGLSVDWLLRGEGEPYSNGSGGALTPRVSPPPGESPAPEPEERLVHIPLLIDIEAAAAGEAGGYLVDMDEAAFEPSGTRLPEWYIRREYGVSPERVFYMQARGDSMVPTILPGQRVLVALLTPGTEVRDGLVYIVRSPGGILVKRLRLEPDHVRVSSDNPLYEGYLVGLARWQDEYVVLAVVLELSLRL